MRAVREIYLKVFEYIVKELKPATMMCKPPVLSPTPLHRAAQTSPYSAGTNGNSTYKQTCAFSPKEAARNRHFRRSPALSVLQAVRWSCLLSVVVLPFYEIRALAPII